MKRFFDLTFRLYFVLTGIVTALGALEVVFNRRQLICGETLVAREEFLPSGIRT